MCQFWYIFVLLLLVRCLKHSSWSRRTSQSSRVSEQGMSALPVPDRETHRNIVARSAEVVRKNIQYLKALLHCSTHTPYCVRGYNNTCLLQVSQFSFFNFQLSTCEWRLDTRLVEDAFDAFFGGFSVFLSEVLFFTKVDVRRELEGNILRIGKRFVGIHFTHICTIDGQRH